MERKREMAAVMGVIVSITEAGKHEHKGKTPAKEFLGRVDSKTV